MWLFVELHFCTTRLSAVFYTRTIKLHWTLTGDEGTVNEAVDNANVDADSIM